MKLVLLAMRRPVTIVVAVLAVILASLLAVQRTRIDIFPDLGAPTVYIAQPYGGLDPQQMEGFVTYYYEYHLLYVSGIQHVESKNIQGAALIKLTFHPGTDMNQAMAEVIGYVNRSRAFFPPGAVPAFVTRFDAGSVAVGQLVFSSPTRSPGEMQNIALNQVRPLFATLPGVSAPPPFGGNQRTMVVRLDPDKLRQHRVSPEEAIAAVNKATTVMPSGVVRIDDLTRIASTNANVGGDVQMLMDSPVRATPGAPMLYLRDIAAVEIGTDIITGFAHVNGKRTVYIPVTKRSDASTLTVLRLVRANLPKMQAVCPDDVKVELIFDQSQYVENALRALIQEGVLGAVLTGLMVLLFLRDWRSALIVIATIPVSLLAAVVWLWAVGQTINIMTIGGLALAVGVLVDEATVEIENIHAHMAEGVSKSRSVLEAASKTAIARFLSMLCVLAVFAPAMLMSGVGKQLFVPLSLAVAFAMLSSYLLSSTLVPVLSAWIMKQEHARGEGQFLRSIYEPVVTAAIRLRWLVVPAYLVLAIGGLWLILPQLGTELFPASATNQLQLRLKAKTGTRIERTELVCLNALEIIKSTVPVEISSAFIGVQPASYPINTIHLWTGGPHEAVLTVALIQAFTEEIAEKLRARFRQEMPDVQFSFEPGDIIGKVLAFGSPTPVEVAVQGPSLPANRAHAAKVYAELAKLTSLRDLQYKQSLDYPSIDVKVDRDRAGQYGLSAAGVAKSLVVATSSSRFVEPMYWRDPGNGNGFQIQVEIPQHRMKSMQDMADIPVMQNGAARPLLSDVAEIKPGTVMGEVERYDMQRVVSMTANIHGKPVGAVGPDLEAAIRRAGEAPKGVTVAIRGQFPALRETFDNLQTGVLIAIGAVFLLLAANFQSIRLALAILLLIPAVLLGVGRTWERSWRSASQWRIRFSC
jgi:multidrug efflux pump subunit AcrB